MKCCLCKEREATVHLTQIVGDKMQKLDLCEECARSKGVNDPTGFSLADLLLGLSGAQETEPRPRSSDLRCPHCGFSQAEFKKLGRFGCPECYQTFAEGLDDLLKTMHKGVRHVGKVPKAYRGVEDLKRRLQRLQQELARAVQEENFERAAELRDEIKQLQARLTTPRGH